MRLSQILKVAMPLLNGIRNANRRAFSSKYLLYTNVGISMTLSAAGDMMEQHYQILFGEMTQYDTRRSVKMVSSCTTIPDTLFIHNSPSRDVPESPWESPVIIGINSLTEGYRDVPSAWYLRRSFGIKSSVVR